MAPAAEQLKLQAMRRIQSAAFYLLQASDYDRLTVAQIAAASEVSRSTLWRYFASKEDIFLWDENAEAVVSEFHGRIGATNPAVAMVDAVDAVWAHRIDDAPDDVLLSRMTLVFSVPQLRLALGARQEDLRRSVADEIAKAGWDRVESAAFAGAVMGALFAALEAWTGEDPREPLASLFDRTSRLVANGVGCVFDEPSAGSSATGPTQDRAN